LISLSCTIWFDSESYLFILLFFLLLPNE